MYGYSILDEHSGRVVRDILHTLLSMQGYKLTESSFAFAVVTSLARCALSQHYTNNIYKVLNQMSVYCSMLDTLYDAMLCIAKEKYCINMIALSV